MFKHKNAFSSFSVDDIKKAKTFYGQTLGLDVSEEPEGLVINVAGGGKVFLYPKPNHTPATFTVLNFSVDDIDAAVATLTARGLSFEKYPDLGQDEKGIVRDPRGPTIAWFTDPAQNILSVLQEKTNK